jgi:acyl-lipid omega-6 desaturase (Delta-12 desaturase)
LTSHSAAETLDRPDEHAVRDEVKTLLSQHRGSRLTASLFQLVSTLLLFVAMWLAIWWSMGVGYWLTLLLALPTAGLLVRLFILQHDCGHGSFFASATANQIVGTMLGAITMTPFQCWRRQHAMHHATNGQLDHRGIGDVDTYTVAEYLALSRWRRLKYRLYRNPLVLFGFGPVIYFGVAQRFTSRLPASWKRERLSVHMTNLMLLCSLALLGWLVGPLSLLKIHLPVLALASSIGTWLFYIQHQFNPTYWEHDDKWDHTSAANHGSSFFDLPGPLRWMTANIGFHHIHHLDSRIPNYALPKCYDAHPQLQTAERLTLWASLRCMHLKLWDEEAQRMVSFREARRLSQAPASSTR